ncbi:MAG: trypsin-like peptidase domain-containing protein [Parvibaculaceae bacterium]
MDLTGNQIRTLREGLQQGFLNTSNLNMFLVEQLNRDINNYAGMADALPTAAFKLIQYAESEGWVDELIVAAVATRPKQQKIAQVATELGLTGLGPNLSNQRPIGGPPAETAAAQLESIIRGRPQFINVEDFLARASAVQSQVCRIEVTRKDGNGTGFLVGPDLVLTNFHVMEPVLSGKALASDVKCRFDYRQLPDGKTVRAGTPFALSPNQWAIDKSSYSEKDKTADGGDPEADKLDYCLIRLAEPAGEGKAGGSQDPNAQDRGWISISKSRNSGTSKDHIFIFQHPEGSPMKMAVGEHLGFNAAGNRMRYDADTLGGSSGSPVFNADLEVIGLHHRGDPKADAIAMTAMNNQGIPLSRIVSLLEQRGVEKFWTD